MAILNASELPVGSENYMRYFIYSAEQLKIRKQIEAKLGKVFKPGTVIVDGKQKDFTEMAKSIESNRYSDRQIVAYGDIRTMKYTTP